jgi:hypothetical protein
MNENTEHPEGHALLMKILSQAAASGADAVEMEYDSGGTLEVCFMSGHTGAGFMLNREDASELIDALWEEKKKARGKPFRVPLDGADCMVSVKTYDHFGDNAYRLTIRKAKH